MGTVMDAIIKSHSKLRPWKQTATDLMPYVPIEDPLAALNCGPLPRADRSESVGGSRHFWEPESTRKRLPDREFFKNSSSSHSPTLTAATERRLWRFPTPQTCTEGRNAEPWSHNAGGKNTGRLRAVSARKLQATTAGPSPSAVGCRGSDDTLCTENRLVASRTRSASLSQTPVVTRGQARGVG